jgi:polyphosphate glucokinase
MGRGNAEVTMNILGIDVGGSAVKGAIVDTETGALVTERQRIVMPESSTPEVVTGIVNQMISVVHYAGPIGVGFPTPLPRGKILLAANIDSSWLGKDANQVFSLATGQPVYVINDADAAGIAEMRFGVGKEFPGGVVILLTLGTGIGSAIFVDGKLLPNTEFGHLQIRGKDAEKRASAAVRKKKKLSWEAWAARLQEYLNHLELLFNPDVFIFGGGVSKSAEKFIPLLETRAKLLPAQLENNAGTIGASLYALEMHIP